jgi:hypothetical protein
METYQVNNQYFTTLHSKTKCKWTLPFERFYGQGQVMLVGHRLFFFPQMPPILTQSEFAILPVCCNEQGIASHVVGHWCRNLGSFCFGLECILNCFHQLKMGLLMLGMPLGRKHLPLG